MRLPAIRTDAVCSKDTLVKVLATALLNPADRNRQGAKIFIRDFLGCGCPDKVVEKATIGFFTRPLGAYLNKRAIHQGASLAVTPLEKEVNGLIKIPRQLTWPRKPSGELIPPALWRRPTLQAVANRRKDQEALARLRQMSKVTIDAVIEVPARAFFFLVIVETKKPQKKGLVLQYEAGQLLYKLMGYNRCRVFTISHSKGPKIIPQIDTALTWQGLYEAFFEKQGQYPFAGLVLDLFVR